MIKKIDLEIKNSMYDGVHDQAAHYIDELDHINTQPLDKKREYNLAKQIRELENEKKLEHPAGKELVERNLRLVKSIVNEYYNKIPNYVEYSEILQEGVFGLLVAVINYDCDFIKEEHKKKGRTEGYRFSTYATNWIKNHIIEFYKGENKNSLNKEVAEDVELIKIIENEERKDVGGNIENIEIKQNIHGSINRLSRRERKIIKLRYGIDSSSTYTLQEVADQMDITRERVRQIEHASLRKLGNMSKIEELRKT
ncbi:sigma-70 family RNA polymerase sigma factor [Candidatus Woesearchaeota archaeon]|nr:sigma-70 family RNA polymerase sigma factor [Candidatus Woesearchaeota archaeon]